MAETRKDPEAASTETVGPYVIINVATAKLLKHYDPDYVPPGTINPTMSGIADWTDTIDRALQFNTAHAALKCWNAQSATVPLRADGRPNKPLTAYSIMVLTVDDALNELRR